jgi:hypothetical protein
VSEGERALAVMFDPKFTKELTSNYRQMASELQVSLSGNPDRHEFPMALSVTFGVEVSGAFGDVDLLEESPVMNDDEAVQLLNDFADYLDEQVIRPSVREITSGLENINSHEPKRTWEMLGEYLRDAAVLILIFVPVDLLIPRSINQQKPMEAKWLVGTLALSLGMLILGIWAERRS